MTVPGAHTLLITRQGLGVFPKNILPNAQADTGLRLPWEQMTDSFLLPHEHSHPQQYISYQTAHQK